MSVYTPIQTAFFLSTLFLTAIACNPISDTIEENGYTLTKILDLPDELAETSGIIFYDSLLWTFNDSRHEAAIYGVDLNDGKIVRTVFLAQAENIDWEDIAQDADFIYIGDFGNNGGDREDLTIYKIPKSLINNNAEQVIHPIEIFYRYEDQIDFTRGTNVTAFDCEAFIVKGDSLVLFTKNWLDLNTSVYRIPKFQGTYVAKKIGEFNSNGLVTGADCIPGHIVLCGYNGYIPFITFIHHGDTLSIPTAPRNSTQLLKELGYQFEGVAYLNQKVYLTAEKSATMQACWEYSE
jgi:hypothetical protein